MGLQLSKTLASGVTGDYTRITRLELQNGDRTRCFTALYVSQADRDAGKPPIQEDVYTWAGGDDPCTVGDMDAANPYGLCYDKLKTLADFSGATDV